MVEDLPRSQEVLRMRCQISRCVAQFLSARAKLLSILFTLPNEACSAPSWGGAAFTALDAAAVNRDFI